MVEFANAICIVRKAQSYLMLQNKKVLHGQLQTLIEKGIFTSKRPSECVECLKKYGVKDARGKESCLKKTHQAEFMEIDDYEISVHNFVEQTHRSFESGIKIEKPINEIRKDIPIYETKKPCKDMDTVLCKILIFSPKTDLASCMQKKSSKT